MLGEFGIQLELATESIVIRAIVGSVIAVVLARLVTQKVHLRSPMVRALGATVPTGALLLVLLLSWPTSRMPTLLRTTTLADGTILHDGRLEWLRPASMALLFGAWFVVAVVRVVLRLVRVQRARRDVLVGSEAAPPHVARLVDRLAAEYGVRVPTVGLSPALEGGACLVGIRRPALVLDRGLVARLDRAELRGVVAHELAHLRRGDNAVALLLGVVRDAVFFVPGSTWALQHLHRERELAADEAAVALTKAPGALASGLLKVIELGRARTGAPEPAVACLLSEGALVERVTALMEPDPTPSRARVGGEVLLVGGAVGFAVLLAILVPRTVADRTDVEGLLLELRPAPAADGRALDGSAAAMQVYRRNELVPATIEPPAEQDALAGSLERGIDAADDAACFDVRRACTSVDDRQGLGMRPSLPPTVELQLPVADRLVTRSTVAIGERVSVSLLRDFDAR